MSRKIKVDHNRFKHLDQSSTWLIGLIAADGCVTCANGHYRLHLASKDRDVIVKATDILDTDVKIGINTSHQGRSIKHRFAVTSDIICTDLRKYNIQERKSLILTFPDAIPDNLLSHFIRGFMDGDGWISLRGTNFHVGFISTYAFLKVLTEQIETHTGVRPRKISEHHKGASVYRTEYKSGRRYGDPLIIMDWLYKNAIYYMNRKYELYQKCFTLIDSSSTVYKRGTSQIK